MKKDWLQLGVHPSVHVAEGSVFESWKGTFCSQIWSRPWISVGFANRMGLGTILPNVQKCGPGARTTHMRWMTDTHLYEIGFGVSCRLVEDFPREFLGDIQQLLQVEL